jgi:hypothetical protein
MAEGSLGRQNDRLGRELAPAEKGGAGRGVGEESRQLGACSGGGDEFLAMPGS